MELIPGKRYRIIFDGRVDEFGMFVLDKQVEDVQIRQFHRDVTQHRTATELLPDPLPTTPGSVVRWDDRTYLLMEDEWWGQPNGASVNATLLAACNFTVLFDAGAAR